MSGGVYCLGFAPFAWWPVAMLSVAVLFYLCHQQRSPAWLAFWFGVGKFGVGVSWVYVSIHVYGNAPPMLAGSLVVLFVITLTMLFAWPLGWAFGFLRSRVLWRDALLFSGLWAGLEWVSSWLFTGFPWLLLGNVIIDTPWASLGPVFGVLASSWWLCGCAAFLAAFVISRRWQLAAVGAVPILLALALSGVQWVTPQRAVEVALVQGNLDQSIKWQRDQVQFNLQRHLTLSEPHWNADLILWPEAAITVLEEQAKTALDQLSERGRASHTALVLGIPGVDWVERLDQPEPTYEFKNLAIGLGTASGRYAKTHLVPFGEYVPLASVLRGLIDFFDLPMSANTPGARAQPNLKLPVGELAMAICYEVAYPETMRARAATAGVLATISNDTWFGASIGPLQHLEIAQMRALENGRWMLRATNNGVTALIDAQGRVQAQLTQFEADVLRGTFQVMAGRTPYNRWGHIPLYLLLAFSLVLGSRYVFMSKASARP